MNMGIEEWDDKRNECIYIIFFIQVKYATLSFRFAAFRLQEFRILYVREIFSSLKKYIFRVDCLRFFLSRSALH